ncbi:MAG TPA: hypothetical protein VF984_11685 [Actinomycetota bacterium]
MHTSAAKLRGHRVADVMQPGGRVHPGPVGQPLERPGEGIRVRGQAISAIAHHRKRIAPLVQWVTPCGAERRTSLELFTSVSPDPLQGEGRELDYPAGSRGL